jgi:DNA-binding transcriptional MerR regulator
MRRVSQIHQKKGYSPTLASKIVGVNYNTILYWVRTRLVRASIRYESKQWAPVYFSFQDLLELKFIQSLREKGASTRRIRKALAILRKNIKKDVADFFIDVTTDEIRIYTDPDTILSAVQAREELLLINIGKMMDEIEEKAKTDLEEAGSIEERDTKVKTQTAS